MQGGCRRQTASKQSLAKVLASWGVPGQTTACKAALHNCPTPRLLLVPVRLPPHAGSYMVGSPMGAERHYTLTYTEFHTRMEDDAAGFRQWFLQVGGVLACALPCCLPKAPLWCAGHVCICCCCCCSCCCCRSMWPRLLRCCFPLLQVESDALQLATGAPWQGEGPFPVG